MIWVIAALFPTGQMVMWKANDFTSLKACEEFIQTDEELARMTPEGSILSCREIPFELRLKVLGEGAA